MRAVTGHHGKPPKEAEGARFSIGSHFGATERSDALLFTRHTAGLLLVDLPPNDALRLFTSEDLLCHLRRASWLLAGFSILCDWIGSDEKKHFQYCCALMSPDEYWRRHALPQAETAIIEAGILPKTTSPKTGMKALFPNITLPSPLQLHTSEIALQNSPQLHILEEATGAGKTEAALALAHRLMAQGLAEGVFIALPTMATANAMYERLASSYRRMFADKEKPSLVLTHSARHLYDLFHDSILKDIAAGRRAYPQNEETASAQCAAWVADNRKKATLADVGVGTVDQALLGILPSRHQSLRLLGVARKVLILDEVHAYDPYMLRLIETLLEFHSAFGGSAILLSATLPLSARQRLTNAYSRGLEKDSFELSSMQYPLATIITNSEAIETGIASRKDNDRYVGIRFIHDDRDALLLMKQAADGGKCACWIRNTVADAIESYRKLRTEVDPDGLQLFHARFAMGDRLNIESEVIARFGKTSNSQHRAGKILVATQVVEQSLDLDFDVMVSDLAPIDLLIQRAGRLQRHPRDRRGNPLTGLGETDQREPPCLHVLSPEPVDSPLDGWYRSRFPQASKIYPSHGQLWLTARMLNKYAGWRMPDDARSLIEGVFGEHPFEPVPEGLARREIIAEGQAGASASFALQNVLKLDEGYADTPGRWLDDTKAPTRLGDINSTVRLARRDGESLIPWFAAERYAWDLSQVNVRAAWIKEEDIEPELLHAAAQAKESMPDRGKWSILVPLSNTGSGEWRGKAKDSAGQTVEVNYSEERGLIVSHR